MNNKLNRLLTKLELEDICDFLLQVAEEKGLDIYGKDGELSTWGIDFAWYIYYRDYSRLTKVNINDYIEYIFEFYENPLSIENFASDIRESINYRKEMENIIL